MGAPFGILPHQANDPFLNWCMVNTNTGGTLESKSWITTQPKQSMGTADQWLDVGNCLFAASTRVPRRGSVGGTDLPNDYAPQIQIAVSAPFNLSTVTNPVLDLLQWR